MVACTQRILLSLIESRLMMVACMYKGVCCVTKYCKVVVVCFVWFVCHNCIACMFFYRGFCYCFVNGFRFTAVPASFTI